jgi:hypothetical protein
VARAMMSRILGLMMTVLLMAEVRTEVPTNAA